jgi:PAS domain S-box-containing protein
MSAKRVRDASFRLLFDDSPQPMWVYDWGTQEFLEVNRAAVERYGYSRDEFLGMKLSDVQAEPADVTARPLGAAQRKGDESAAVWRHKLKDGRRLDVVMAVHNIDYRGRRAALAVPIDVTDRRMLEDQLRQAKKMEALGMLAGGIAHDFNNLLTIITGYSQLILNGLASHDANRSGMEQIMKAGERAAALTRQLLAFSRRQVVQPRVLEINKLVGGLGSLLNRVIGEDIELRLVLSPGAGRINADAGQIEQVIMNLAVNSRDAMPRGGILTIETSNVILDEEYVRRHLAVRPGRYVLLAVSDTGIGMDSVTRAHLFEPFFTTKGQGRGTGLGLSIVFGIVKQGGGNIEVYSEPGRGTSVKVYLPRVDQGESPEQAKEAARAWGGTETILLVEDEDMVRRLVRETLERQGYKVLDAAGPVEALRIVQQHGEALHLLITDVVMPKMSGRELAEHALRERPDLKILYMSGYTDNAVLATDVLVSEMPFLQKPFSPEVLTRKVRQVLDAPLEGATDERRRRAGGS